MYLVGCTSGQGIMSKIVERWFHPMFPIFEFSYWISVCARNTQEWLSRNSWRNLCYLKIFNAFCIFDSNSQSKMRGKILLRFLFRTISCFSYQLLKIRHKNINCSPADRLKLKKYRHFNSAILCCLIVQPLYY